MRIVSCIQDSFQEYKNKQSLVLFCKGCNFNCKGCYNYASVTKDKSIGDAKELIDKLITPMHDAVVFLGGEPTIWHGELIEAAKHAKNKGLLVKVYSNGFLPETVRLLNEKRLVDAWSIDVKCVENTEEITGTNNCPVAYLGAIKQSLQNICEHSLDVEIRTTLWPEVSEQIQAVKDFVANSFPSIKHIVQDDFNNNLNRLSA